MKILISILFFPIVAFLVWEFATPGSFSGQSIVQRRNYKEIGTSAAPLTLTDAFNDSASASSTPVLSSGLNRVVIGGTWTPKSVGSRLYIKLQQSLDGGTTYFDRSIDQQSPTYGFAGSAASAITSSTIAAVGATSTSGIPWVIGDLTTASGTAITFLLPPVEILSDYVKVFFQEFTSTTHGTIHSQVLLSN